MSRPLYAIPILNELHELYPDLLYHPSRFQSGNDVITYIVDRGIRRSFREESLQYHRRMAQQAQAQQSQQAQQAQQANHDPLHNASVIDEFDVILHGGRIAPRIYPSPAPDAASAAESANEFIPLLPASPIDQLLSYFIRESMDSDFSIGVIPSPLRPTEEQLRDRTTVQTVTENEECAICQDAMVVGQTSRRLPCQHAFHLSCVDTWFSLRPTCPTCRRDVRME
uniref:RING-type domain-containing protein n=1 Tax=viral metagenome TaxID=1070528 RepID=A0A6C0BG34_9ZZZZ